MIQLVQQWLSTNGRFKSPVVVLSMRLDVSDNLQYTQNPGEVGSKANEGMDVPAKARASRQKASFLLPCPSYRLPAEGVAHIKGRSSHLERSRLKANLSISKYLD